MTSRQYKSDTMSYTPGSFESCFRWHRDLLYRAPKTFAERWQGQTIHHRPEMQPHELLNVTLDMPTPYVANYPMDAQTQLKYLAEEIKPNLPWADQHFEERVSGTPWNPPPSHEIWPHAQAGNGEHLHNGKFSHTYPERFWPKFAGERPAHMFEEPFDKDPMPGLRFDYGDLQDVVDLLRRDPATRQAWIPIWFPEDTGAVEGQRVPCTIGYQPIIRDSILHMVYVIRSCDLMRHFRDDVYLAYRLMLWLCIQLMDQGVHVVPGDLTMHITSFHIFDGDLPIIEMQRRRESKRA